MSNRIAEAYATARTRIDDAVLEVRGRVDDARHTVSGFTEAALLLRSAAPTLTTALLIVVAGLGAWGGWWASSKYTRWTVNTEWRGKIAAASKAAKAVVKDGNEEAERVDDDVIKAIGETDDKLADAERRLRAALAAVPVDRCTVPADCLRQR